MAYKSEEIQMLRAPAYVRSTEGKSIPALKSGLYDLYKNPQAIILCLILSIPIWFFEVSSIYFSSKAIHFELAPSLAVIFGIVAFIAQAIPTTPAGIGVHEGTIAGILLLFGINTSTGSSIALVDHFARGIIIYTFGLVPAAHIGFESRIYFKNKR